MMRRITILLILVVPAFVGIGRAQTRTVAGRVTNLHNGQPISAGRVFLKDSNLRDDLRGDGVFVLRRVPLRHVTLVVESAGFHAQEMTVPADEEVVFVTLEPLSVALEGVVVSGMAVQPKHSNVSTARVSGEELDNVPVASVEQALQGRVAGADIQQNSGVPGGDLQMRLRGVTTLLGSSAPLFVLDGVMLADPQLSGGTSVITGAPARLPGRIADLNPSDIAGIQILKGAAATTLYGSKGSNGVVIITTKRGGS